MAKGFDDFEMKDLGRKYPKYDDMNREELNNEYDSLTQDRLNLLRNDTDPQDEKFVDVKERTNYIDRILENRFGSRAGETTFTSNNDSKTVTIKRKGDPSTSVLAPELGLTAKLLESPENKKYLLLKTL